MIDREIANTIQLIRYVSNSKANPNTFIYIHVCVQLLHYI